MSKLNLTALTYKGWLEKRYSVPTLRKMGARGSKNIICLLENCCKDGAPPLDDEDIRDLYYRYQKDMWWVLFKHTQGINTWPMEYLTEKQKEMHGSPVYKEDGFILLLIQVVTEIICNELN